MSTETSRSRIEARLQESFVHLRENEVGSADVDALASFLRSPRALRVPSLIVRCRVSGGVVDYETVVNKPKSAWRLTYQFMPFLDRIQRRLHGEADFLVLISDSMYVADEHVSQCVALLKRAPLLRCDWLDGDPVSSHSIVIPDFTLQDDKYAGDVVAIDEAASRIPFAVREDVIKWRGRLTGPGFPDLENCHLFPRYRLLELAATARDVLDARLTYRDNFPNTPSGRALLKHLDGLQGGQAPEMAPAEFASYKYLISVDGVTSTWKRVCDSLRTGSVLLLQHRWKQFFHPGLIAWEHYVPVLDDLSDLFTRYEWLSAHPEQSQRIANEGRRFAKEFLSIQAIEDHFVAVFDACATLMRR